jgi:glyoxylate/hydroxypyruvate reductase
MIASHDTILFCSSFDSAGRWQSVLHEELPDISFRIFPDEGDPEDVTVALVWKPPENFFAAFPNLQLIVNLGSGVDMLLNRSDLPNVPVMRIVDPGMVALMQSYVLFAVIRYARNIDRFETAQQRGEWHYIHPRPLSDVKVGVLGLGGLGGSAALSLARLGFDVRGWSRTPKEIEGVTCSHGLAALDALLEECEIIALMLPLTSETRHLMNAERLRRMQRGAKLINVGRGELVEEQSLIACLEEAHLGGVTLDVFSVEPLPEDSALWRLPNVLITPHLASITVPEVAARDVAESVRRVREGLPPLNVVDFSRGY